MNNFCWNKSQTIDASAFAPVGVLTICVYQMGGNKDIVLRNHLFKFVLFIFGIQVYGQRSREIHLFQARIPPESHVLNKRNALSHEFDIRFIYKNNNNTWQKRTETLIFNKYFQILFNFFFAITKNKISLRLLKVCAYISSAFFSYVALTGLTLRGQFLHRSKLLC